MKKILQLISIIFLFSCGYTPIFSKKEVESALRTKKKISVQVGPNNVHDILDSLEENH